MPETVNSSEVLNAPVQQYAIYVKGQYDTLADLQAAHPTGEEGDAYNVGDHLYVWDVVTSAWVSAGEEVSTMSAVLARLQALESVYAKLSGSLADNPITRTSPSGHTASLMQHGYTAGDEAEICDIGWDFANRDGAMLGLNSASKSTLAGQFSLVARDATNTSEFNGLPDGTLTWNGKDVITSKGGTFSGALLFNSSGATIARTNDTQGLSIWGGSTIANGANLALNGKDNPQQPGRFTLRARDGTNNSELVGSPDGKLIWVGDDVLVSPGYYSEDFATKSVPNDAITNLGSFTLTKGLYLVYLTAAFANNTTGYRQIHLASNATGSSLSRYHSFIFAPCPAPGTGKLSCLLHVTASSATYYINAYQNSGSALNVSLAGYQYMKIRGY